MHSLPARLRSRAISRKDPFWDGAVSCDKHPSVSIHSSGADMQQLIRPCLFLTCELTRANSSRSWHKQTIFVKRFVRTTAIILSLFFFTACNPSKAPEANATPTSPAASGPTITASPNPVSTGGRNGTTTVTWNTGDGAEGQVFVSVDGSPEGLFATAPSGSAPAGWIQEGKTFEFRLYAGTEHAKVLSKTQVTGHK
jgi:hypothetical protein